MKWRQAARVRDDDGWLWDAVQKHWLLTFSIAACLGLAFLFHSSGGEDDRYITYWAARSLADHGQILNYNGVRLEQSSSLSLVIALAILYKLTPFSMPMAGFLASMGFAAVTLALSVRVARLMDLPSPRLVAPLIGTVGCFAYWATAGMESTLVTATALWVVIEIAGLQGPADWRKWTRLFVAMWAFAASRPESPIVLACMLAALLVGWGASRARGPNWMRGRTVALVIAVAAIAVGSLLLFRRLYFHAWIPNPATVKAAAFNREEGINYLWDAFAWNGFWLMAGAIAGFVVIGARAFRGRMREPASLLIVGLGAAQLGFILISGGDWMSAARFLAPCIPAIVLVGMVAVSAVGAAERAIPALALVLVGANTLAQVQFLHTGEGEGRPAWTLGAFDKMFRKRYGDHGFSRIEFANRLHLRDAVLVHHLLPIVERATQVRQRPIWMATGQAGMMPYHVTARFFPKTRLIDLWALTSRELLDCLRPGEASMSKAGMSHSMQWYLDNTDRFQKECGLPPADIYFNECISDGDKKLLQKKGYVLVFNMGGTLLTSKSQKFFPGKLGACGFIAVKKDLADEMGLKAVTSDLVFDMNPR